MIFFWAFWTAVTTCSLEMGLSRKSLTLYWMGGLGIGKIGVSGQDDYLDLRVMFADMFCQLQPVRFRHPDIGDDDVDGQLF